jgi:GntR family transcriptional regulator/MocR family aminotransferase
MAFLKPPLPSLKSLDRDGRVIYVGSFSKSLFPGLRLGFLMGSEPFIREARALRASVLRHPPGHLQRSAAYFLSLGHYDALVARMARAFHDRRRVMESAMTEAGMTIAGRGAFGGSSYWMEAPEGVDATELAERLMKRDVLIEPGAPFFGPGRDAGRHYRLAYSSIPAARIGEGIGRIAEAIAETRPVWT